MARMIAKLLLMMLGQPVRPGYQPTGTAETLDTIGRPPNMGSAGRR